MCNKNVTQNSRNNNYFLGTAGGGGGVRTVVIIECCRYVFRWERVVAVRDGQGGLPNSPVPDDNALNARTLVVPIAVLLFPRPECDRHRFRVQQWLFRVFVHVI